MSTRKRGLAVAVGNFDGVHLGHRWLLRRVTEVADEKGLTPGVVTFRRHPLTVLRPGNVPATITTNDERRRRLADAGMERVVELDFTSALSAMTAEAFVKMLRRDYDVRHLVIGYNTVMGSDRMSNPEDFRVACQRAGVELSCAGEFRVGKGCDTSSTAVRRCLERGDVEGAATVLGKYHEIAGRVVDGQKLGRQMGFPTANIDVEKGMALPGRGVYACVATLDDCRRVGAMVNVGCRPTVSDCDKSSVEAHLLGFSGNLYGRDIRIEFVSRLREERKFGDLEELRKQLERDREATERVLSPLRKPEMKEK